MAGILSQQTELSAELLFEELPASFEDSSPAHESLNEYIQACERKYIGNSLVSMTVVSQKPPYLWGSAGKTCEKNEKAGYLEVLIGHPTRS